jgi:hypothetical protein
MLHSSILIFLNLIVDGSKSIQQIIDFCESRQIDAPEFLEAMRSSAELYENSERKVLQDATNGILPLLPPKNMDEIALYLMQEGTRMPPIKSLATTIYFDGDNKVQVGYDLDGVPLNNKDYTEDEKRQIRNYLDAFYQSYLFDKGVALNQDGQFATKDQKIITADEFRNKYLGGSGSAYRSIVGNNSTVQMRSHSLDTAVDMAQQMEKEQPGMKAK